MQDGSDTQMASTGTEAMFLRKERMSCSKDLLRSTLHWWWCCHCGMLHHPTNICPLLLPEKLVFRIAPQLVLAFFTQKLQQHCELPLPTVLSKRIGRERRAEGSAGSPNLCWMQHLWDAHPYKKLPHPHKERAVGDEQQRK